MKQTRHVNPYEAGGTFVPLFDWLMRVEMTGRQRQLYGLLAFECRNGGSPRVKHLSKMLGAHERDVRQWLADLVRLELIEIDHSGNARGLPSRYAFISHPEMGKSPRGEKTPGGESAPPPTEETTAHPAGGNAADPPGGNAAHSSDLKKGSDKEERETRASARERSSSSGDPIQAEAEAVLADHATAEVDMRLVELVFSRLRKAANGAMYRSSPSDRQHCKHVVSWAREEHKPNELRALARAIVNFLRHEPPTKGWPFHFFATDPGRFHAMSTRIAQRPKGAAYQEWKAPEAESKYPYREALR